MFTTPRVFQNDNPYSGSPPLKWSYITPHQDRTHWMTEGNEKQQVRQLLNSEPKLEKRKSISSRKSQFERIMRGIN